MIKSNISKVQSVNEAWTRVASILVSKMYWCKDYGSSEKIFKDLVLLTEVINDLNEDCGYREKMLKELTILKGAINNALAE